MQNSFTQEIVSDITNAMTRHLDNVYTDVEETFELLENLPIVMKYKNKINSLEKELTELKHENLLLKLENNTTKKVEEKNINLEVTERNSSKLPITKEDVEKSIEEVSFNDWNSGLSTYNGLSMNEEEKSNELLDLYKSLQEKINSDTDEDGLNPMERQLNLFTGSAERDKKIIIGFDDEDLKIRTKKVQEKLIAEAIAEHEGVEEEDDEEDEEDEDEGVEEEDEEEDEGVEEEDVEDEDEEEDVEDEDVEDEDVEEDEDKTNFAETVLLSQKAGEYATIDTASEEEEEEDEEFEVEEIKFDGSIYYTNDTKNGVIFEYLEDSEIGDEIGYLKNGKLFIS